MQNFAGGGGGIPPAGGGAFDAFLDALFDITYTTMQNLSSAANLHKITPMDYTVYFNPDFGTKVQRSTDNIAQAADSITAIFNAVQSALQQFGRTLESTVAGAVNPLPGTGGRQPEFPYKVYAPGPATQLMETLLGVQEGLRPQPKLLPEQIAYYEPLTQGARTISHTLPFVFGEYAQGDLNRLIRELGRYRWEVSKEHIQTSGATRDLFTSTRINLLMNALSDIPEEVQRAFRAATTHATAPVIQKTAEAATVPLREIPKTLEVMADIPNLDTVVNALRKTAFGTEPQPATVEGINQAVNEAINAIKSLRALSTAPFHFIEANRRMEDALGVFTAQFAETLSRTADQLPQGLSNSLHKLATQQAKVEQTRQRLSEFLQEFYQLTAEAPKRMQQKATLQQEYAAVARQAEEKENQLRQLLQQRAAAEEELQRLQYQTPTVGVTTRRRELQQQIERYEKAISSIQEELSSIEEKKVSIQQRIQEVATQEVRQRELRSELLPKTTQEYQEARQAFSQAIEEMLQAARKATQPGTAPEVRALIDSYLPQLEKLHEAYQKLTGEIPAVVAPTPAEGAGGAPPEKPPVGVPGFPAGEIPEPLSVNTLAATLSQAARTAIGMTMHSMQIALMFGMSAGVFQGLTQIPMEATYRAISPVYTALGGLTGIQQLYHQIAGFAYQVPAIIQDFNARMIMLQSMFGSRGAAAGLLESALQIARVQPIQFPEALETLTAMAVYPSTRRMVTNPEFQRVALETVQLLATLVPEQGIGGAIFAIREMLGGQWRSLQRRFNISPEVLAQYAGVTTPELKGAPGAEKLELLHRALVNLFGGSELLFRRGAQFDVQLRNIADTFASGILLPLVRDISIPLQRVTDQLVSTGKIQYLLPQPQYQALEQGAAYRAYFALPQEIRASLDRWIAQQTSKQLGPAERIQMAIQHPRAIGQDIAEAVRNALSQQRILLTREAYATPTGTLALVTTALNTLIQPLVEGLQIPQAVSNLIARYSGPILQQAVRFREEIAVASPAEQKELTKRFVQTFIRTLGEAISDVTAQLESGTFQELSGAVATVIRKAIMAPFRPVIAEMVQQTAQTAIELPGILVGDTLQRAVYAVGQGNIPSIRESLGTLTGIGAWMSLQAMPVLGIGRAAAAFGGFSILQHAVTNRAEPLWYRVGETALGTGLLITGLGGRQAATTIWNSITNALEIAAGTAVGSRLIGPFRGMFTRLGEMISVPTVEGAAQVPWYRALLPVAGRFVAGLGGIQAGWDIYQALTQGPQYEELPLTARIGRVLRSVGDIATLLGAVTAVLQPELGIAWLLMGGGAVGGLAGKYIEEKATPPEITRKYTSQQEQEQAATTRGVTFINDLYRLAQQQAFRSAQELRRYKVDETTITQFREAASKLNLATAEIGTRVLQMIQRYEPTRGREIGPIGKEDRQAAIAEIFAGLTRSYYTGEVTEKTLRERIHDIVSKSIAKPLSEQGVALPRRQEIADELTDLIISKLRELKSQPIEVRGQIIRPEEAAQQYVQIGREAIGRRALEEAQEEYTRAIFGYRRPIRAPSDMNFEVMREQIYKMIDNVNRIGQGFSGAINALDNLRRAQVEYFRKEAPPEEVGRLGQEEYLLKAAIQSRLRRMEEEGYTPQEIAYWRAYYNRELIDAQRALYGRRIPGYAQVTEQIDRLRQVYGEFLHRAITGGAYDVTQLLGAPARAAQAAEAMTKAGYTDVWSVIFDAFRNKTQQLTKDAVTQINQLAQIVPTITPMQQVLTQIQQQPQPQQRQVPQERPQTTPREEKPQVPPTQAPTAPTTTPVREERVTPHVERRAPTPEERRETAQLPIMTSLEGFTTLSRGLTAATEQIKSTVSQIGAATQRAVPPQVQQAEQRHREERTEQAQPETVQQATQQRREERIQLQPNRVDIQAGRADIRAQHTTIAQITQPTAPTPETQRTHATTREQIIEQERRARAEHIADIQQLIGEYLQEETRQQLERAIPRTQGVLRAAYSTMATGLLPPSQYFDMLREYGTQLHEALSRGLIEPSKIFTSPQATMQAFLAMRLAGYPTTEISSVATESIAAEAEKRFTAVQRILDRATQPLQQITQIVQPAPQPQQLYQPTTPKEKYYPETVQVGTQQVQAYYKFGEERPSIVVPPQQAKGAEVQRVYEALSEGRFRREVTPEGRVFYQIEGKQYPVTQPRPEFITTTQRAPSEERKEIPTPTVVPQQFVAAVSTFAQAAQHFSQAAVTPQPTTPQVIQQTPTLTQGRIQATQPPRTETQPQTDTVLNKIQQIVCPPCPTQPQQVQTTPQTAERATPTPRAPQLPQELATVAKIAPAITALNATVVPPALQNTPQAETIQIPIPRGNVQMQQTVITPPEVQIPENVRLQNVQSVVMPLQRTQEGEQNVVILNVAKLISNNSTIN